MFVDNIIADRWTLDHMKSTYDQKIHDSHPDSFQVCSYSAVPLSALVLIVLEVCCLNIRNFIRLLKLPKNLLP